MANFYSRFFAKIYDRFMEGAEASVLSKKRHKLLSDLKGDILEIGSGTGTNFQYYNLESNITAIEPSLPMLNKSLPKNNNQKTIEILHRGLYDFDSNGKKYDAVVCTLVLCTIPNLQKAIDTIKGHLKQGGKLIILEHIHAKKNPKKTLLNIINPLWRLAGEGCNLNRSTDTILRNNNFKPLWENHFSYSLNWYEGVFQLEE